MIGSLFATPPYYIPRAQLGPRMNLVNPDPTGPTTNTVGVECGLTTHMSRCRRRREGPNASEASRDFSFAEARKGVRGAAPSGCSWVFEDTSGNGACCQVDDVGV